MQASVGKLNGKVAIITGASSGIGKSTALLFSELGARLCLVGRNEKKLQEVKDLCCEKSEKCEPLIVNTDVKVDCNCIVDNTLKRFGVIDILVNNAGIIAFGSIETTSLEQYDHVFNTNVRAIYDLTMKCVPHLIVSKGNIVNVSSVNGIRSFPGVLAYNMSKAALDQFTKCVALELAGKGVRVNSVNPGVVVTNLQKTGGLDEASYSQFLERSKSTHPIGRAAEPCEVSAAIAFLASDMASFITGTTLPVCGGRSVASLR